MRTQTKARRWWIGLPLALLAAAVLGTTSWGASAPVDVILEIANTADPNLLGAPVYEISAVVFMKDASSLLVRSFFPFIALAPGQSRTLGPFPLDDTPTTLTLLGRSGPPGPYMQTLAITWTPLVPDTAYEENTLRVVARFGADLEPDTVVLTGYLSKLLQLWCTKSEGPLYVLQTEELAPGLDGFYILVHGSRLPWLEDPLLEMLLHTTVQIRGRLVPAGEEIRIHEGFPVTYPLPALIVEEITETDRRERCAP